MKLKNEIMNTDKMKRALIRISHEIVEHNDNLENLIIVGIKKRGVFLANIISKNIHDSYQVETPVGVLDISQFRDDIDKRLQQKKSIANDIPYDIDGKTIILVDDVLYTGRTVRAAIEAIFTLGRPKNIQLAVLVDRGHRELPIRADYVGKNVPTSRNEEVIVSIEEIDRQENVLLYDIE